MSKLENIENQNTFNNNKKHINFLKNTSIDKISDYIDDKTLEKILDNIVIIYPIDSQNKAVWRWNWFILDNWKIVTNNHVIKDWIKKFLIYDLNWNKIDITSIEKWINTEDIWFLNFDINKTNKTWYEKKIDFFERWKNTEWFVLWVQDYKSSISLFFKWITLENCTFSFIENLFKTSKKDDVCYNWKNKFELTPWTSWSPIFDKTWTFLWVHKWVDWFDNNRWEIVPLNQINTTKIDL